MATLNIKALSAGISLFALFMVGTISAKANTHEGEKKEKEVKAATKKILVNQTWYFTGTSNNDITNAESYSSEADAPCSGAPQTICEIDAPASLDNPELPDMEFEVEPGVTVADQIEASLQGSPSLNTTVKSHRSF